MAYGSTAEEDREKASWWIKRITWAAAGITAVVVAIVIAFGLISPQLRLYKANTEKQAVIAEARAKADSAGFLKDAEITRAEGVAEANRIIANSITDEYTRWLYVDQLDEIDGQIIYVPTEAGIPILEAQRLATNPND